MRIHNKGNNMINGNIKTYGAMAITIIVLIVGIIYGYATLGHQVEDNTEMQPKVELNSEHRIKFEEKVDNMEKNIGLNLDEVRKRKRVNHIWKSSETISVTPLNVLWAKTTSVK